jgi:hypothetical protein
MGVIMAKLTGPLFSIDASGSFAKTVTYSRWKGRRYGRFRAIPSNPRTEGQEQARSDITSSARVTTFLYRTLLKRAGVTDLDVDILRVHAPADITWANYLVLNMIGPNGSNMRAAETAWTALTSQQKDDWEAAAAALTPSLMPAPQTGEGGVFVANKSPGELLFTYIRTLDQLGHATLVPGTPPVFA